MNDFDLKTIDIVSKIRHLGRTYLKIPSAGYRINVFGSLIIPWDTRRLYYATISISLCFSCTPVLFN